jgi:hypothetical protein
MEGFQGGRNNILTDVGKLGIGASVNAKDLDRRVHDSNLLN